VALVDNNTATPTFTPLTVLDNTSEVLRFQLTVTDSGSLTASDNVDITVKWVGFADDFSTNTIPGTYNPTQTQANPTGSLTYDSAGKRALVETGDDVGLNSPTRSRPAPRGYSRSISARRPLIRPMEGSGFDCSRVIHWITTVTRSRISTGAPVPPSSRISLRWKKIVGGVVVDTVTVPSAYTQLNTYNIKITFSSTQVVLEGFGTPVTLNTANPTAISVTSFEIETGQQDAYYDNIKLLAHP